MRKQSELITQILDRHPPKLTANLTELHFTAGESFDQYEFPEIIDDKGSLENDTIKF